MSYESKRREALQAIDGERMQFTAIVSGFGIKHAYRGWPPETLLLTDVRRADTGEQVTDHLWFTAGSRWKDVYEGVTVDFFARVGQYEKGYHGHRFEEWSETDWRLELPTKVRIISSPDGIDPEIALERRHAEYESSRHTY